MLTFVKIGGIKIKDMKKKTTQNCSHYKTEITLYTTENVKNYIHY